MMYQKKTIRDNKQAAFSHRWTISVLWTVLLMCCALGVRAQSFTLQGKVSDTNGNPIELASVMVVSQGKLAMTNLKGEFSLELHSADSVAVRFSMVGYRTKTRVLRRPRGRQTLMVQLADDNTLGEVTVEGKKKRQGTTEQLDLQTTQQAPSVSGNAVEEMVQTQAGVSTHSELTSQYNVRGGSFDENSVYINDVEVYRPFLVRSGQQEGLSVINPDMVASVGFSSGGFEAKYGDKMSSALDITYKRPTRTEAKVSASLLGASAYVGLAAKKFTWTNGLRYKTNRYVLGSLETNGEYKPNFLDYQTYLSWQPTKRWQLDLIGNISENHYNFRPEDRNTNFGTMENVKNFQVYFDGQEKDLFRTFLRIAGLDTQTEGQQDFRLSHRVDLHHEGARALRHPGTVLADADGDFRKPWCGYLYAAFARLSQGDGGQRQTHDAPHDGPPPCGGCAALEDGTRHGKLC